MTNEECDHKGQVIPHPRCATEVCAWGVRGRHVTEAEDGTPEGAQKEFCRGCLMSVG